ncbi:leucyl aminopeptidase [Patescibacteria group bacterium]|nr:leucyl aminopeptidase [Patescibacteria group bacterium]
MKFIVTSQKSLKGDNVVVPCFVKQNKLWLNNLVLSAAEKRILKDYFLGKNFTATNQETKVLFIGRRKIILLGLGEFKNWDQRKFILAIRRLLIVAKSEKIKSLALPVVRLPLAKVSYEKLGQLIAENALMADYSFNQYKKGSSKKKFSLKIFSLLVNKEEESLIRQGLKIGQVVGEQVNVARDLGNTPGGDMTPDLLAKQAVEQGKKYKFKVEVLTKNQIQKLGMGAILGVAKGSVEEPKFIIMEHWGVAKNQAPYVLVGKGVTFDSGGLNLKPSNGINDMHLDMLGAAAVIGLMGAVSRLKLPVNIIGLVPAVENMPSGSGLRPGDLLKGLSGKTIEVLNTDAEGRLILSDALTYAEKYKPKLVVDIATLTGACVVALGTLPIGLFTPSDELQKKFQVVGELSGDYVWPLPMWQEYEEEIKGTFGDVQNIGKTSYGGAIQAAMFLWQFAKKYPWVHLDIAGPMKTFEGQYLNKGASGVGVRFLFELVRQELAG